MTRQIYVAEREKKKGGSVKEVGEVSGARSVLSLTDRCMGFHARFCAAESFTLGLTSGMCESRVVLWFTVFNSEVENSLGHWE